MNVITLHDIRIHLCTVYSNVCDFQVNAQDDNGAIMGNWTRNFEGGTAPTEWMGSSLILRKFLKERKPVKYGQCWVFAGVMTTGIV